MTGRRCLSRAALALALLAGCRGAPSAWAPGDSLAVGSARALALDARGRPWLVDGGALRPLVRRGPAPPGLRLPGGDSARWVGSWGVHLYLRTPTALLAIETDSNRVHRRPLDGALALDSARGAVLVATAGGAILGLGPRTLVPLWGWPRTGGTTTALVVGGLGDRLYQALLEDEPRLLVRDRPTGRLLRAAPLAAAPVSLAADSLRLYAAAGSPFHATVEALLPDRERPRTLWRRRLVAIDGRRATVRLRPGRPELLLLAPPRMAVLARADGRLLATLRPVRDAVLLDDGTVLALRPTGWLVRLRLRAPPPDTLPLPLETPAP